MPHLEQRTVQVEWQRKADDLPDWMPAEWKADAAKPNILIGYASTFGNVDRGGDVVKSGAFTKTIENIKANGIPLLADHLASTASLLGTIFDAKEDKKGLLIKARVSSAPSAQDVAIKAREGHLNKMSIGYETLKESFEDREIDGLAVKVRNLEEIKLWETSVVVFPMNPEAVISGMKSMAVEYLSETERQELATKLAASESETADVSTVDLPGKSQVRCPAADAEAADAKSDSTPNTGGESGSAPGEGASGYDKYASRAILAGRPLEEVDPVKRAELATRLALAESQLPSIETEGND